MAHVHFLDVRIVEEIRSGLLALAGCGNCRVNDRTIPAVRAKNEFSRREIFRKNIRIIRNAWVSVDKNRAHFSIGVAVRKRPIGQQDEVLRRFRDSQTNTTRSDDSLNRERMSEAIAESLAGIICNLSVDRHESQRRT